MQRLDEIRIGAETSIGKFIDDTDTARLSPNQPYHVSLYVVCQLMEILFESAMFCGNPIPVVKERFPSAKIELLTRGKYLYMHVNFKISQNRKYFCGMVMN